MIVLNSKLRIVPALQSLNALALKFIFDKQHMTKEEERRLDEGLQLWVRKTDMRLYEKKELQAIVEALLADKEGRYNSEKFAYARAGIDYRRVYTEGI